MQFATLTALAFAAVAVAIPTGSDPSNQCSTGPVQCCNSVQSASSHTAAGLLTLLGVVVQDLTTDVGITCSPLTGVGAGGMDCNQQAVCCSNNSFNGVVAIGCTPININA